MMLIIKTKQTRGCSGIFFNLFIRSFYMKCSKLFFVNIILFSVGTMLFGNDAVQNPAINNDFYVGIMHKNDETHYRFADHRVEIIENSEGFLRIYCSDGLVVKNADGSIDNWDDNSFEKLCIDGTIEGRYPGEKINLVVTKHEGGESASWNWKEGATWVRKDNVITSSDGLIVVMLPGGGVSVIFPKNYKGDPLELGHKEVLDTSNGKFIRVDSESSQH